jgi:fimbrial chaperone protein
MESKFIKMLFSTVSTMIITSTAAMAFETIMTQEHIIMGKSYQQTFVVSNSQKEPIAVEVSVAKRSYTRTGVEELNTDQEELLAIPSQMIINPGDQQVVALRWVGSQELSRELPFRIIAENVPIEISTSNPQTKAKAAGQIRLVYRMVKSFYVRPENVSPLVSLKQVSVGQDKNKQPLLILHMTNKGTQHQIIRKMQVSVTYPSQKKQTYFTLDLSQKELDGGVNLLAGEERDIPIPFPKNQPIPSNDISLTASLNSFSEN